MFSITGEENLPVLIGLAIGGGISLAILLALGFSGLGGSGARIKSGRIIAHALATLSERTGALILLWFGVSLSYTAITLFTQLVGRTTSVFETAMAAALVFLGHKAMLERPAKAAGVEVPQTGFWRVLLISLALGVMMLATVGLVFLLAALFVAMAGLAGWSGETPRLIAGFGAGTGAIWLSTLFARLTFIYPSSVLGGRDWFGTALGRAGPIANGLSASLWLVAAGAITLIIPLVIWSNTLVLAIATALPASPGELQDDFGTTLFWLRLVMEELPLNLLLVAYSLASIACVSAAYRLTVLSPPSPASPR